MDTTIGIKGKDFVLMVCDAGVGRSIMKLTNNHDKIMTVDDDKLLCCAGDLSDSVNFANYVQKNVHLYKYRNGYKLSVKETANWARLQLAKAIRRQPWQTNTLLAGFEKDNGPQLYWMDAYGTLSNQDYCAHGYGAYFMWGIFDNQYKPKEAVDLVKACLAETKKRFIIGQNKFIYKVVDANGVTVLDIE